MKKSFDFIVVGGGSGGLAAAKEAAGHGAKVALVERGRIGGTCVLRGCVPKKLMVKAAQLGLARELAAAYGWPSHADSQGPIDWATMTRERNRVVNNLELAHTRHLANAGIEVLAAHGRLASGGQVEAGNVTLNGDHILWATGSTPRVPTFPGHHHLTTSDQFFALAQRPSRVVVLGGGYIAVEFACMLRAMGSQVTVIARSQVLRPFDEDLQEGCRQGMRQLGIEVVEHHAVGEVRAGPGGMLEVVAGPQKGPMRSFAAQAAVLCAAGRTPTTHDSGLAAAGVRLGPKGGIEVDEDHQSSRPGLYAVGDVIDRVNLTPVAIRAGRLVAQRLFAGGVATLNYDNVATAVFATPAIGSVGMSEAEARQRAGGPIRIYRSKFVPLTDSVAPKHAQRHGLAKLVVDDASDRVLGCHLQGDEAPEIVQGFAAAMVAGVTKAQLDQTLAVHPTAAEETVLMRQPWRPAAEG